METEVVLPAEEEADAWLAPIFLDERAEAYPVLRTENTECHANNQPSAYCNPIGSARISNKGFLPLTLDQYLSLLDTIGRIIRKGKCGFIPQSLAPILDRLKPKLDAQSWLDSFLAALGIERSSAINNVPLTAFG